MGAITHGTVEFNRRLNTGDYSHKDAKVTLSFTVNEGDDIAAVTAYVGTVALAQAMVMVGESGTATTLEPEKAKRTRKAAEVTIPASPLPPNAGAPAAPPSVALVPPSAPVAGPVAPIAPPASVPVAPSSPGTATGPALNAAGQPVVHPLPVAAPIAPVVAPPGPTPPVPVAPPTTPVAPAPVPAATPAAPAASPAVPANGEISDATIGNTIYQTLERLEPATGPGKVTELLRRYIAAPGRAVDLPQSHRPQFLTELGALA